MNTEIPARTTPFNLWDVAVAYLLTSERNADTQTGNRVVQIITREHSIEEVLRTVQPSLGNPTFPSGLKISDVHITEIKFRGQVFLLSDTQHEPRNTQP